MNAVLYIHGRGGSADEAAWYAPLFPACEVVGLDYKGSTPWDTKEEMIEAVKALKAKYTKVFLIANSIGAYFVMNAGVEKDIAHAYFISPVINMEKLITDMMRYAGVTEAELREKDVIKTSFDEDLSWDYLCYVRDNPIKWSVPTDILCGGRDALVCVDTTEAFAKAHNASLTVMENGEHWFHTKQQMRFLRDWMKEKIE